MRFPGWYVLVLCSIFLVCFSGCPGPQKKDSNPTPVNSNNDNSSKTVDVVVAPKQQEPESMPLNWSEDPEQTEGQWQKLRELYVLQHIENPASIMWAAKHPLGETTQEDIEKGYGIYWSASGDCSRELEYGMFLARTDKTSVLEENLATLGKQGKGREYYLLLYIAVLHYFNREEQAKAQKLATADNLFEQIVNFAIAIPSVQLNFLRENLGTVSVGTSETEKSSSETVEESSSENTSAPEETTTTEEVTEDTGMTNLGEEVEGEEQYEDFQGEGIDEESTEAEDSTEEGR